MLDYNIEFTVGILYYTVLSLYINIYIYHAIHVIILLLHNNNVILRYVDDAKPQKKMCVWYVISHYNIVYSSGVHIYPYMVLWGIVEENVLTHDQLLRKNDSPVALHDKNLLECDGSGKVIIIIRS